MRTCCWILLSSLLASPALAQETRGNISGTVRDAQGVIPGATVTITGTDTGAVQRLVSNSSGYFEAPLVQPGNYQISVAMSGYRLRSRMSTASSAYSAWTVSQDSSRRPCDDTIEPHPSRLQPRPARP